MEKLSNIFKKVMERWGKEFGFDVRQLDQLRKEYRSPRYWKYAFERLEKEEEPSLSKLKKYLVEAKYFPEKESQKESQPEPKLYPEAELRLPDGPLAKPSSNPRDNCPNCGRNNSLSEVPLIGLIMCPWCHCGWMPGTREVVLPAPRRSI